MNEIICEEATLRQVDAYEKSLCPWCGVCLTGMVFGDSAAIESPLLCAAPWADAALLWGECTHCGQRFYDLEVSVVAEAPPGRWLVNDHWYEAAGHTLYVASRGRREWRLVHFCGVRKMNFASIDPGAGSGRATDVDVPWLDEHIFGPMAWRNGRASAVKLTEMLLPCLRRISWPKG